MTPEPVLTGLNDRFGAPWHRASFDLFLNQRLPELLAARLPLAGYSALQSAGNTCRVTVEIVLNAHTLTLDYPDLPQPDAEGLFQIDGEAHIVVPFASREELDQAEVKCVGERLFDYIAARLGQAPADIAWDEPVARAFLPLDAWFAQFLRGTAQWLDQTNWHARHTHLRRILVFNELQEAEDNAALDAGLSRSLLHGAGRVVAPGQMGRVDPFETPEGTYIGHIFTIASGAEIRAGKIVITDPSPTGSLGHNSLMVPFLEHGDANRLLMGVNMMRQGLTPPEAEPAWVQTGHEPAQAGPDFWCGRNLLTALIFWGEAAVEDGIILSQSGARHLGHPYPAEVGDKLANRHGIKGVVSQILPDAEMPHLPDGTPVEMIYSAATLPRRLSYGMVREAVMGRIARAEGRPAVVPPFQAPTSDQIRARLAAAGLSETGMERLRAAQDGPELAYPATVGWVYWYRLAHLARPKLQAVGAPAPEGAPRLAFNRPLFTYGTRQAIGEMELGLLRQTGALHTAREALTLRSERWTGELPSPYLRALAARLAAAGLALERQADGLHVSFRAPAGAGLQLARPLPHPWLREQTLARVGAPPEGCSPAAQAAYTALAQANDRLARWLAAQTALPAASGYLDNLLAQVETRLSAYLDALLPPEALKVYEQQAYSGIAVIAPGLGLHLDQVGLPDELAQVLFAERAARLGVSLDAAMQDSWVILHRAITVTPGALTAFRPLRVSGPALRLPPLACALLNVDFDGDALTVHLPVSPEAQAEAAQRLSPAAHLARDPGLLTTLLPHEALWGLAYRSLSPAGRREIAARLGQPENGIPAPLSQAALGMALRAILEREGPPAAIRAAEDLAQIGYAACMETGASFSPFATSPLPLPPPPASADPDAWESYVEGCVEALLSGRDYTDPILGPQLLSAAIRQRSRSGIRYLFVPVGPQINPDGQRVITRHTPIEGRTPQELFASVSGARQGLARLVLEGERILQEPSSAENAAFTLLARARRARHPGVVFARAAASGEVDPLTDVETRLLI